MNLTDDLIPRITTQFEDVLKRTVEDLSALRGRMNLLYADIRLSYANWRAQDLLNNKLDWNNMVYKQVRRPLARSIMRFKADSTTCFTRKFLSDIQVPRRFL
jgi:hypothetical protein